MKTTCLAILLFLPLGACINERSGGNSTSSPGTTFPLLQATQTLQTTGFSQLTGSVSGTSTTNGTQQSLTGSYFVAEGAALAGATFGGQAAQSQSISITADVSNKVNTAATLGIANTTYFTTSGTLLGETSPGNYCIASKFEQYPATVTVGQAGPVATLSCYTDSTMATANGTIVTSYTISAGPSSATATFTATHTVLDNSGQQVTQVLTNFQLYISGNLTFQSVSFNETLDGTQYQVASQ
jgi:hypothetical protein